MFSRMRKPRTLLHRRAKSNALPPPKLYDGSDSAVIRGTFVVARVENLAKMSTRNYKSSSSQTDNCMEKILRHIVARFGLILTIAVLLVATVVAQETPSAPGPRLPPNADGEEAVVKRLVDGIMQPYLAEGQHNE